MAAEATQAVSPSNGSLCLDAAANRDGVAVVSQSTAVANTESSKNAAAVAKRAPTVEDAQANAELASAWADMEDRMFRLAEMSKGTEYDPNLKKENVMDNFDTVRSEREKKSAKWGKLRKTVDNTLTVISNVGGMVADAASQVFAPAGQCYNALNFVISAYKGYASIFETLNDIFSKCAMYLGRVNKYAEGKMSRELAGHAVKVLRTFVEVCDQALHLRSSFFFKTTTFLQIAFLNDNKFANYLQAMDDLSREEELERGADMYLRINATKDTTDEIKETLDLQEAERSEESKEKKNKRRLLSVLKFSTSPDVWDGQGPIATWSTTYQNIRHQTVDGTGKWLFTQKEFTNWTKKGSDTPVLGIVGGEASGKTYLAASVISHLRTSDAGERNNSRRLVSFYFLDERKTNSGIEVLGKSVIWQFTESDASYMQSAVSICKNSGDIDPKELLPRFLLSKSEELKDIDVMFYIVLNKVGDKHGNVHKSVSNFLEAASHASRGPVRVLFTATEDTSKKLQASGLKFPTVSMDRNKPDVDLYITDRLNKSENLSNAEDAEIKELRQYIQTGLPTKTKGNYFLMDKALSKISKQDFDKEIRNAVDNADQTLTHHIANDISVLNQKRSKKELEEINELILWITFAKERMTTEKLKAALELKNGATSLRPLEDRLKKYLLFEVENGGRVTFRSEQVLDHVPERAGAAKKRQDNNEDVTKNEVDILNHFLGNVCPPQLVQKLQLHEHFDQKLKPRQEQIYQEDKNNGEFQLVKGCLKALTHEPKAHLRLLRDYAVRYLIVHMSAVNIAEIDAESKREIGPLLVKLFRDDVAINNLFWSGGTNPKFPPWLHEPKTVSRICTWLQATSAEAQSDGDAKQWVNELISGGQDGMRIIVEPSIVRMAHNFLQEELGAPNAIATFKIIESFVTEFYKPRNSEESELMHDKKIEQWCLEKLHVREPDSLWHTQMALVISRRGNSSEIQQRCLLALEKNQDDWRPMAFMAAWMSDKRQAIKELKKVIGRFNKAEDSEDYAEITWALGDTYWQMKEYEEAKKWWSVSIEYGPMKYSFLPQIITGYYSLKWWDAIVDIIQMLHSKSHLTPAMVAISKGPINEAIQKGILLAAVKTEKLELLDLVYPNAIKLAVKEGNYRASFNLRRAYASALSAQFPPPTDHIVEILEAAAADVPYTETDLAATFFLVGYRLGAIYLSNAREAQGNGKDAEAKKWLDRMSTVVPESVTENQMRLPLSLFAARYYAVNGDRPAGKRLAHNTLRMAIELLADEDEGNDEFAYKKILYAAIPFGDDINAASALAMMKREAPNGKFRQYCSCPCNHKWTSPGDMYWCMDCINVVLTPKCKDAIKDEKFRSPICHHSHKHLYIPAWDEEKMSKVPDGEVPYDGSIISMKKWRKELSTKYHLN